MLRAGRAGKKSLGPCKRFTVGLFALGLLRPGTTSELGKTTDRMYAGSAESIQVPTPAIVDVGFVPDASKEVEPPGLSS